MDLKIIFVNELGAYWQVDVHGFDHKPKPIRYDWGECYGRNPKLSDIKDFKDYMSFRSFIVNRNLNVIKDFKLELFGHVVRHLEPVNTYMIWIHNDSII